MDDIVQEIQSRRIIPVIALEDASKATALAEALISGGLPIAEVTFRTAAAAEAIRSMAQLGRRILIGAGTVLNVETVKRAIDAGARFIVSPGFNPRVVEYCQRNQIAVFPGVATPTDIEQAIEQGVTVVKFFPAEAFGGIKTLRALAAPYGMTRFIPTGGISAANVANYLKFPRVLACGGSWMVSPELLASGSFERVTVLSREAVDLATSAASA